MGYVGKTCVNVKYKKEIGVANRGTVNSGKEPPFLLNKGILRRQMDKCFVTLAMNMPV